MRYLALKNAGEKKAVVKIATGLTPEQKREFIIKDNAAFGDFDFEILANAWDDLPLVDWGVDLPKDWILEINDDELPELGSGTEKEKMTICPKCGFKYAI